MIHVQVDKKVQQVGWSLCYCESCGQVEAARCEEISEDVRIMLLQVQSGVVGGQGACDFCERPVTHWLSNQIAGLDDWSPQHGLLALIERLEPDLAPTIRTGNADARLHSMLSMAQQKSVAWRVINPVGVLLSGAVGAVLGGYGCWLLQRAPEGAELEGPVLWGFALGLTGMLVSAILMNWIIGGRLIQQMITYACETYGVNPADLARVAQGYPRRIRRVIARYRDHERMR